jgi:hypothetical protein
VSRGEGELLTVPKPRAVGLLPVCLTVKPVGEPDALIGHVRFDERGWETERCRMAQATAPILDSTLASIRTHALNGRFSNRPFGVKRFQTIHRCSVDVAHGLVLLFGIGTRALPSWESRTRRNNLLGGLAVRRAAGPSDQTNSPHPSSREGHHSTAQWNSGGPLISLKRGGRIFGEK